MPRSSWIHRQGLPRAVARRGAFKGDPTVATIVVVIAALLAIFIFYPVGKVLAAALFDAKGQIAPALVVESACVMPMSVVARRRSIISWGSSP